MRRPVSTPQIDPTGDTSVFSRVAEAIRSGVRGGTFVPGQQLSEPDVVHLYGVSRSTTREAFKHVAAAGIITLTRFGGTYISRLDSQSVLDLRATLDPLARLAARLAATHCKSAPQRAMMGEAAARIETALHDFSGWSYLQQQHNFYRDMVALTNNRELMRCVSPARLDLVRSPLESLRTQKQRACHAARYTAVVASILDGNALAADRAVDKLLTEVVQRASSSER